MIAIWFMKESSAGCDRGLSRFICHAPHQVLSFVLPIGIFSIVCTECTAGPFGVGCLVETVALGGNMVV